MANKQKTQITINSELEIIVASIQRQYPIFNTNQAIEFLLAKGSGAYLESNGLTMDDLRDIQKSRQQVAEGKTARLPI